MSRKAQGYSGCHFSYLHLVYGKNDTVADEWRRLSRTVLPCSPPSPSRQISRYINSSYNDVICHKTVELVCFCGVVVETGHRPITELCKVCCIEYLALIKNLDSKFSKYYTVWIFIYLPIYFCPLLLLVSREAKVCETIVQQNYTLSLCVSTREIYVVPVCVYNINILCPCVHLQQKFTLSLCVSTTKYTFSLCVPVIEI